MNQANGLRFRCSPRMNSKLNGTLQGLVCKLDETAGTEKMSQVHYCWSQIGFRRVDTEMQVRGEHPAADVVRGANGVMLSLRSIQRGADAVRRIKTKACQGKKIGRELVHAHLLKGLQTSNLRSRNCCLCLVREGALFSRSIHSGSNVKICLARLYRGVGEGGVGIHRIDLRVGSACFPAAINVVANDGSRRTRRPGKRDAVLRRRRRVSRQGLLQ